MHCEKNSCIAKRSNAYQEKEIHASQRRGHALQVKEFMYCGKKVMHRKRRNSFIAKNVMHRKKKSCIAREESHASQDKEFMHCGEKSCIAERIHALQEKKFMHCGKCHASRNEIRH